MFYALWRPYAFFLSRFYCIFAGLLTTADKLKKILFICLFFLSVFSVRAGEVDIEKPADAFATWTDVIVRKDYNNWHVGGLIEYCTINKGQGLKSNEFTLRPIVGYNPLP